MVKYIVKHHNSLISNYNSLPQRCRGRACVSKRGSFFNHQIKMNENDPFPWYYGRTVGEWYGCNKRLLQAVLRGKEDQRWAGFIEIALSGRIPEQYTDYIRPFIGTKEQKLVLMELLVTIGRG